MKRIFMCCAAFGFAALFNGCGGAQAHQSGEHHDHGQGESCGGGEHGSCSCEGHGEGEHGEGGSCGGEGGACSCGGQGGEGHAGGGHCDHGAHEGHGAHDGHGAHEGHGQMPADMAPIHEFHEAIAPVWHSEPGAGRSQMACNAANDFEAKAAAIASAPTPSHAAANETAYRGAVSSLQQSIGQLKTACASAATAGGSDTRDAALTSVHSAFHSVMETAHPRH